MEASQSDIDRLAACKNQRQFAEVYAEFLNTHEHCDTEFWGAINLLIMERYKPSALPRIKAAAWDIWYREVRRA